MHKRGWRFFHPLLSPDKIPSLLSSLFASHVQFPCYFVSIILPCSHRSSLVTSHTLRFFLRFPFLSSILLSVSLHILFSFAEVEGLRFRLDHHRTYLFEKQVRWPSVKKSENRSSRNCPRQSAMLNTMRGFGTDASLRAMAR